MRKFLNKKRYNKIAMIANPEKTSIILREIRHNAKYYIFVNCVF